MRHQKIPAGAVTLALGLMLPCGVPPAFAQDGEPGGEWRAYGADSSATKYSPLDQIDATNVGQLEVAWTRPTIDPSLLAAAPDLAYSNANRATPLMIGGVVYAPNAVGLVEAWDPATGETIWVQQPVGDGPAAYRGAGHRGIAYWTDGTGEPHHRSPWRVALRARIRTPEPRSPASARAVAST